MAWTRDQWTSQKRGADGNPVRNANGKIVREKNSRWGRGKRWLAVWLDPDGRERTAAFNTKVEAERYGGAQETDLSRGDYFDPKAGKEQFAGIAERWFTSRSVDPSSAIRYESVYRLHLDPVFGRRAVRSIKPSDIAMFQRELSERFGPSTLAAARLVLVGILDLAVEDELIKKNPAKSSAVPRADAADRERIVAWDSERVLRVIDGHPKSLQLLPAIGATCGLREGELFALAEEDIDFEEGVLHVRRQLKKVGKHYLFGLPKNDQPRVVPLPKWTAASIRTHVKAHPPKPLSLPWEKPGGPLRTHRVLCRWLDGGYVKARAYSETVWKPALVAAGVIPAPTTDARGRRRYVTTRKEGTHQLRHHYASMMLADGVNIRELAEYLGHADPSFTLRIYSHLLPDSHDRARRAVDRRMLGPRPIRTGALTEQQLSRAEDRAVATE